VEINCKADGVGPELLLNYVWPSKHSMDEHGSGMLSDGTDVALCNAILMVDIHAAEFDALFLLDAALAKVFGGKNAIIGMIAIDGMIVVKSM
jgi:hypothetical protein